MRFFNTDWGKVVVAILGALITSGVMALITIGEVKGEVKGLVVQIAATQEEVVRLRDDMDTADEARVTRVELVGVLEQINQRLADIRADIRNRR